MHMIEIMQDVILRLFNTATLRHWREGQTLFHVGDHPTIIHLVVSGRVVLSRTLADGTEMVLQSASPGAILAEASAYSSGYHCAARAAQSSTTRAMDIKAFRIAVDRQPLVAAAWAASLASSIQTTRFRVEVRSLRTVRARLDAWLSDGNSLPSLGHVQDLAAEIGVSREALYRELARRR